LNFFFQFFQKAKKRGKKVTMMASLVTCVTCCRFYMAITRVENGSDSDGYHRYYICFHISIWIRIRIRIVSSMSDGIRDIDIINMDLSIRIPIWYRRLNIRTRIWVDLNSSKWIESRIWSENIRTIFIPSCNVVALPMS
jgi:hypothetical protein